MTHDEILKLCGKERGQSFSMAVEHAVEREVKCIIETGTYRGSECDGESTVLFSRVANELGADFYSIDNSEKHIDLANQHLESLGLKGVCALSDSIVFLSLFMSPIGMLYLDSYDYDANNPLAAQIHQVAELGAAWGKLTPHCVVLLDDCNLEGGGKGLLTSKLLIEHGFGLKYDSYQRLFVR